MVAKTFSKAKKIQKKDSKILPPPVLEFSQSELEQININSQFYKALSHPSRLAICLVLLEVDECYQSELESTLKLEQGSVSQYTDKLERLGCINKRKQDGRVYCSLTEEFRIRCSPFIVQSLDRYSNK